MLVPLSWLKEYVPIKFSVARLCERLAEVGVGVENIHKKEEDTILELEITPNRADLLSIIGIAREIAAMQSANKIVPITPPALTPIPKPKKRLPLRLKVDYSLSPRVSAIIIDSIKVKESPLWLQERLTSIGLRSINNIVDITNFVMMELGNPLHAFDYDQIRGHTMTVMAATGGESFTSVDNISYKLPKGANIIRDKERIIDLCGIKGGANSGISKKTKTVLFWAAVDEAINIRQTSQRLGLRSEASNIYERGVNKGGTLDALARAVALTRKFAGGSVASTVFDLKKTKFEPWSVTLSKNHLAKLLGITIDEKKVIKILSSLSLSPKKNGDIISVTVPTYRNDLQIAQDIIEEVARLYGYNAFPKTLPKGEIPTNEVPYERDFEKELTVKRVLAMLGMSEANTYSLVSRDEAELFQEEQEPIYVANPVSREFEVLRPSLLINLLKAIPLNTKFRETISLFELGKKYFQKGKSGFEPYAVAGVSYPSDYFDIKGIVEAFFEAHSLSAKFIPHEEGKPYQKNKIASISIYDEHVGFVGEMGKTVRDKLGIAKSVGCFELDLEKLLPLLPKVKIYTPIPKYPPLIEDLSIIVEKKVLTGGIIGEIKATSPLVDHVDFLDIFEDTRTFRITFQHQEKNLSSPEVAIIRKLILRRLKQKFGAELKS